MISKGNGVFGKNEINPKILNVRKGKEQCSDGSGI